jgi:hypothetical protein
MSLRKHVARVMAIALVTTAAAGPGTAHAAAQPLLTFRQAGDHVTVERFVDGDTAVWFELNFGVHMVAGQQPFEVRAKRQTYADPVVATVGGVPAPPGIFTSFNGFEDFTSITIRDTAGAVVEDYSTDWCPNSGASVRSRPDAPARNPYPFDCGFWAYGGDGNPFLLGAVWGVQAGYATPIQSAPPADLWTGEPSVDVPGGDYQVTVELNEPYRSWLGVPAADAVKTLDLTVVDIQVGGLPPAAARSTKASDPHSAHATEGDPGKQVAAYDPKFRPPAKVPASLAAVPAGGPRPDLRSLPAWDVQLEQGGEDGRTYVTFSATVWNAGTSPLVVDGFRRTGEDIMDAYQYFYDAAGNEIGARQSGTMEWDAREGHLHWHFTDFAQYNLLAADRELAVRSGKEAFCLANTDPVDLTLPRANWQPGNNDLASSCGANTAVAVREVLDVGSGDTYIQSLPGQSFDVTDLPNGTYWIEVLANPDGHLAELRTGNNSSVRKIILGGAPGARTLRVPAVHGIDG